MLFEDPSRVKIIHDCKQDSTALKFLMDIDLKNVFDTSGMNMVLEQK
jgi:ribonuclease D